MSDTAAHPREDDPEDSEEPTGGADDGAPGDSDDAPGAGAVSTGAESVVAALEAAGAETAFGVQGGAIMPVYDALYSSSIDHVTMAHEQGAAHAADAYGVVSGEPGLCLATSGPGATNLVTGIADADMDSDAMLALTGQVPTEFVGNDAFQETDTSASRGRSRSTTTSRTAPTPSATSSARRSSCRAPGAPDRRSSTSRRTSRRTGPTGRPDRRRRRPARTPTRTPTPTRSRRPRGPSRTPTDRSVCSAAA